MAQQRIALAFGATLVLLTGAIARAQSPNPQDANVNAIRASTSIADIDRRKLAEWVQAEVAACTNAAAKEKGNAFQEFRTRYLAQLQNPSNSQVFNTELLKQTAAVAVTEFARQDLDATASMSLAHVLAGAGRPEAYPALIAGLKARDHATRFLCAKGLLALQPALAADRDDKNKIPNTINAIRDAALVETSSVVLGRMYAAMVYRAQPGPSLDALLAVLDTRIAARKAGTVGVEGAELGALEAVEDVEFIKALAPPQKAQLAQRVAAMLRMDADAYQATDLPFDEIDILERKMWSAELVLVALAGEASGGKVRSELDAGGHGRRADVLKQVYAWVGKPGGTEPGALNNQTWGVPVGGL